MPKVTSAIDIDGVDLPHVWQVVCDFEAYPDAMEDVLEVHFVQHDDAAASSWRVLLNGSELTWTERDRFHAMERIEFDQIEGDLEVFRGVWALARIPGGVRVVLEVEFDLGIPSLATLLDPIGIQAIRSNSRNMLEAIGRGGARVVPS